MVYAWLNLHDSVFALLFMVQTDSYLIYYVDWVIEMIPVFITDITDTLREAVFKDYFLINC